MSTSAIVSPPVGTTRHDYLSHDFQQRLSAWNHRRLDPARPHDDWEAELAEELRMRRLEGLFVEDQRGVIAAQAEGAPEHVEDFIAWFEALKQTGPGQNDPLFPWLATEAPLEDMRWFLLQEVAGEAGFDDLVALTQVKMPTRAKLELARNYWDEMGRGVEAGMHGPMLAQLATALDLEPTIDGTHAASLALGNSWSPSPPRGATPITPSAPWASSS
jgi:hypothetical protein